MKQAVWSDPRYESIARLLSVRAGLSFRPSQFAATEQGIQRAMHHAACRDLGAYLQLVTTDADKLDDLLVQTTVGETYFFRNPDQFRVIGEQILPELRRLRPANHKLQLWSAGCASGEEPYTLAMLLHQKGLSSRSSVLGTDVSREALERARQATYRDWSLRGVAAELASPYLTCVEQRYCVKPEIRSAVHFEYLNLALDNYPSTATGTRGVDLILCRNVMIYFDRDTVRSVVSRFHRCLADGGWLVTAATDPPVHEFGLFEVVSTDYGMFYRKGTAGTRQRNFADTEPASLPPVDASDEPTQGAEADRCTCAPPAQPQPSADERLATARQAIVEGDYETAAAVAGELLALDEAVVIHIRALANLDVAKAESACAAATQRRPLSKDLHYLHAVLLMDLSRHAEAADALRRVLYLDRSLALAHFSLGSALRTLGESEAARRAFRNVQELCAALPPDTLLPLGEDDRAGDLLEIAELQLKTLDGARGARP